jgi:tRNA dimethylallyltransferase
MSLRLAVFGPTAVGKTEFCLALARAVGGEIVNADAVQLYRGFDRGAAKPTLRERQDVAHHLLDIADPGMEITVASYQALAREAIVEIERRGAVPIVSGGSGLYLRAALGEWRGFGLPPDPEVRRWAAQTPVGEIRKRAAAVDPVAVEGIAPSDRPRLVRIIERQAGSGSTRSEPLATGGFLKIGLMLPRDELYRRIEQRALALWPSLVVETEALLLQGISAVALAARTIGYREALAHLKGDLSEEEALQRVRIGTRRLAKRQLTWWRRERDTIWLHPQDGLRQLLACIGR